MHIGYHAPNIPLRMRDHRYPYSFLTNIYVFLDSLFVLEEIAMVHRVSFQLRTFNIEMARRIRHQDRV